MAIAPMKGDVFSLQLDLTGGTTFVSLAGVTNEISFSSDSDVIEYAALGDDIKSNMPGAVAPGSTQLQIYFTAADSQHKALIGAYHARTVGNWRVYNNSLSAVHRGPFLGFISSWSDGITKGEVHTATIVITHTEATGLQST